MIILGSSKLIFLILEKMTTKPPEPPNPTSPAPDANPPNPMDWKHYALVKKVGLKRDPGHQEPFGFHVDEKGPGVLVVRDVRPGSAAATAGMLAGDIVLTVGGRRIMTKDCLAKEMTTGDQIRLTLARPRSKALEIGDLNPPTGQRKSDSTYAICR